MTKKQVTIVMFIVVVVLGTFGVIVDRKLARQADDHIVIDTITVSTAESSPIITRTITREFKPGDTLTSKENGAWTLWDSTMIRELQVAFVTDSGTIQILK